MWGWGCRLGHRNRAAHLQVLGNRTASGSARDGAPVSRGTDPVLPDLGMSGKIGDYRLDGHIGRGGMAVVYLAQDERLDRTVALKIIAPELARDAAFRTRFLHESRAAAAVGHPNIIPVYDAGDAGR